MPKDPVYVTRRRFLASLATVGSASAASGAGTAAFFTDSETSQNNQITAGTLNLMLGGNDETVEFLVEENIEPGDSGSMDLPIQNAGTVPGYLTVEVESFRNYENGLAGNEGSRDDSGGDPGEGKGELQNHLQVSAGFQDEPEPWFDSEQAASALGKDDVYDPELELGSDHTATFQFTWVVPSETGREVRSDSIEFELKFNLTQRTSSES